MKVVFVEEADTDLEQIADYIAKDNPRRAATFVRELQRAALRLQDAPRAFPCIPRNEHRGIRRRPFRHYLIFYRIDDELIYILRILHGARDYEAVLFPDS